MAPDAIIQTIMEEIDVDSDEPVESDVIDVTWYSTKSLKIAVEKTGDFTTNSVRVEVQGCETEDGDFVTLVDDLTSGIVSFSDEGVILKALKTYVPFLRILVTNATENPDANYPTVTAVVMGRV